MDHMSTNFGVDSSSCFPFREWTNTDTTDHPTHAMATAMWVMDWCNATNSDILAHNLGHYALQPTISSNEQ